MNFYQRSFKQFHKLSWGEHIFATDKQINYKFPRIMCKQIFRFFVRNKKLLCLLNSQTKYLRFAGETDKGKQNTALDETAM